MKYKSLLKVAPVLLASTLLAACGLTHQKPKLDTNTIQLSAPKTAMEISSTNVTSGIGLANAQIFNGWGCTGNNISPELAWKDAPKGTKSYAITMFDPDAPTGSGWWHWMVVNIPSTVNNLPEGAGALNSTTLPKGATQITNNFGYKGFGGACPPPNSKPHNYLITVYALNTAHINIPKDATAPLVGYLLSSHIIGEAQLVAPTSNR